MRIISWNVNGIRAVLKKDFASSLEYLNPDVICFQETKAQDHQVQEALASFFEYELYSNSAVKKGYSGTAILSKVKPIRVFSDIGIEEHDQEGRVLTAEFKDFFVVTVYVPNSGSELKRLSYRKTWDEDFFEFIKNLEEIKPVLVCGDFNVAHKEVDLARPKPNYNKSAGFMQEEIDGMDRYVGGGLLDTWRELNPEATDKYSWWSYRAGARQKNVGWRIDYFLASEKLLPKVKEAMIFDEVMGSDHCPVGVEL